MNVFIFKNRNRAVALLLTAVLCCQVFAGCGETAPVGEPTVPQSSISGSLPTEPTGGPSDVTEPTQPETAPTEPSIPETTPTEPSAPVVTPTEPEDDEPDDPSHTYGQWVIIKAATCTSTGTKSRQCTTCGYESVVTIAKTEHNMIAGTCADCGYSKTSTGITYHSYGNGTCRVDDLLYCYDKDVVIPTHSPAGDLVVELGACLIDDVYTPYHRSITIPETVTEIEPAAFRQGKNLEHLYVHPDNPVYYSVQDCVIEKETGTLVAATKNCVFPTDGSLKVIGAMCFDGIRTLTSITIPSSVHTIGEGAFYNTGIVNLVIPDTVTNIDSDAFRGIKTLQSVRIGSGVKVLRGTFAECPALKSVTFAGDIEVLDAFDGCTALEQIDIPKSVVELGGFDGCSSLKKITIPSGVQVLYGNAFANCTKLENVVIPDGVQVLPSQAFRGCSSLKSVTIPDSVTTFEGWSIFYGCSSLKSIHIPEGVDMLDKYVFTGCSSLEHVVLPRSLKVIDDSAFAGCSGMKTLTVGDRLYAIAVNAFDGCSNLDYIYASHSDDPIIRVEGNCLINGGTVLLGTVNSVIPNDGSITSIASSAFSGNTRITHIEIPAGVVGINSEAFSGCTNLLSITLPEGLRFICRDAFYGCTSLREIKIPNTVTLIQEYAFARCTALTKIVIPQSVTTVEKEAFFWCEGLKEVTIEGEGVTLEWLAFDRCSNVMVLRLPKTFNEEDNCLPPYHSDMTVYYAGTMAEWKATLADTYYTGKIICSDGVHQ